MEILTKLRCLSLAQTYFKIMQIRGLKTVKDKFIDFREGKKPRNLEKIPGFAELWTRYCAIATAENFFKKTVFDELFSECNINGAEMHYLEKLLLIETDIGTLIRHGYIQNVGSVTRGLLSNLESFPFDCEKICKTENVNCLSVKHIRDLVEQEYLAWKFGIEQGRLKEILWRYRFCLFEYRSMKTLKTNLELIEKLPKGSEKCVAEKIYLVNQKPCSKSSLLNFQETIAGLNWNLFPEYCPQVLKHSHQYILLIISSLTEMGFTEKQIQEGLPFLYLKFPSFFKRLNSMLTHPTVAEYKNEDKFLWLLSYYTPRLYDLVNLKKASFEELTDFVCLSKHFMPKVKYTSTKSIMHHVNQYYKLDYGVCTKGLRKDHRYKIVPLKQINDTLNFLKTLSFTPNEIQESISLVLYPRNFIQSALTKIKEEAATLEKCGFKNGRVYKETNFFNAGTKEKQKSLQLCLYYLEKPSNFTGGGLWEHSNNVAQEETQSPSTH